MRLTETSKKLIIFLSKKNCVPEIAQTKKTKDIILKLYDEIKTANEYIMSLKNKNGANFYNLKISRINNINEIPRPRVYSEKAFPEDVRKHINAHATYLLSYTFSLFGRVIHFKFIVEDSMIEKHVELYNHYVDTMLIWLYILNDYASKECSKELVVYLYFTTLKKLLPESNVSVLSETNVNTAYTTTCPRVSDIVIFRREEWFKVFMHETFHNFALDFSDMNVENCTRRILSIFPIKSEVNLFEVYAEFWAEFMNCLFCCFFALKNKNKNKNKNNTNTNANANANANNTNEFIDNVEDCLHLERAHCFFQVVKILDFMGLKYKDLYSKTSSSASARELLYKENTNVFSYYVLKAVLFCNYPGFLNWCDTHNLSLLQFKKTSRNLDEFCDYIERNYKTKSMLEAVDCTEDLVAKTQKKFSNKKMDYLMQNMRMAVCELG